MQAKAATCLRYQTSTRAGRGLEIRVDGEAGREAEHLAHSMQRRVGSHVQRPWASRGRFVYARRTPRRDGGLRQSPEVKDQGEGGGGAMVGRSLTHLLPQRQSGKKKQCHLLQKHAMKEV